MAAIETTATAVGARGGRSIALPLKKQDFGSLTALGAFEPTPADLDRRKVDNYGLPDVVAAAYAWVKTDDDVYFHVVRQVHSVMSPRLRVTTAGRGEAGRDIDETRRSHYGYVREQADADRWALSGSRGTSDDPIGFELAFDAHMDVTWNEQGILDLRCARLGPALEMYFPAAATPWYWNCLMFRVEGEIVGQRVSGFGEIEFSWGTGWQDWLEHPLEAVDYWVYYAIEAEDGQTEYGTAALVGGSGFGIAVTGGQAEALYGIEYDGEDGPDGMPTRVSWRHGDRSWSLDVATRSISSPRNPGFCWQLGTVDRDGAAVPWGVGFVETRPDLKGHYMLAPSTP
jgi:hypothetical protein